MTALTRTVLTQEGAPTRPPSGRTPVARRTSRRLGAWWIPWAFLAPALVLFVYFKFIPMGQAFVMSFQDVQPYLGNSWVGWDNYRALVATDEFLAAAGHTAIIYHPTDDGLANSILGFFLIEPSQWINSPDTSLLSVILVGIWRDAPYDMIIIIAGLVGVDRSLYEASALDGAGWVRRIRYVTLPALRPALAILLTLAAIRAMRIFTEVYLLTNGGPNGSSEVLMTLIYRLGFERVELGVAAAGSVVLLLATIVLTLLVRSGVRKEES